MALPPSFRASGFTGIPVSRYRSLMLSLEGGDNSGKTELSWTAPGPALQLALDGGYQGVLENPTPPASRNLWYGENLLVEPIEAPLNTGVTQDDAKNSWRLFYQGKYLPMLQNPDARTGILDGDSDSFEWQMLAEFGRTTQIPQIQRTSLNAARRVMISRAQRSGKFFISTSKLKKKYEPVYDHLGNPVMDPQKPTEQKRDWDGETFERQGFNDHEYGYELQLRCLYKPAEKSWGARFLRVKANRSLEGEEVWGKYCRLPFILLLVYSHIPLVEWGYDAGLQAEIEKL